MNKADLVLFNGMVHTVDESNPLAEAIAVRDGIIQFVGNTKAVKEWIGDTTKILDLQGRTVVPGFIECHGHFLKLGFSKMEINLSQVTAYEQLLQMVSQAVKKAGPGEWIHGSGWHQNKWSTDTVDFVNGFPTHHALSSISPDNPVFLTHACAHAGFANKKAMELAGVSSTSTFSKDGEILKDSLGEPTGMFNEKAQKLITDIIPEPSRVKYRQAVIRACEECLSHGITSFHDAGCKKDTITLFKEMIECKELTLRMYGMLDGEDRELLATWYSRGPEIGFGNNFLTIRAVKLLSDGAIGSRSAWMIEPYTDNPHNRGYNNIPMEYLYQVSKECVHHGFQLNVHAIGDRANREVLNQYEVVLEGLNKNGLDHRFRLEHAQHVHPDDIPRIGQMGVIASIQGIHFSSDRSWIIDCLGRERIENGSYPWQSFIQAGVKVVNGSDAPIEPVDPIAGFYALVTRKTLQGFPFNGYEPHQKLTRVQALRAYTIDAAYSAFEEQLKGSIEIGKVADFTVLSQDIMNIDEKQLLNTKVITTILDGRVVYEQ